MRAVAKGGDASRHDEGGDASCRHAPDDDDASWRYGPWSPSIALDIPLSLGDNVSPLKRVFSGRSQAPSGAQQHMPQHMLSGHARHGGPAAGRGEARHAGGGTGRGVEIELGRGGYRGRRHGMASARARARKRGWGGVWRRDGSTTSPATTCRKRTSGKLFCSSRPRPTSFLPRLLYELCPPDQVRVLECWRGRVGVWLLLVPLLPPLNVKVQATSGS